VNADVFLLDGHAYSWRQLCALRREQLEAIRKANGTQATLFELREDRRPDSQRSAARRYQEPSLLDLILLDNGGHHQISHGRVSWHSRGTK
jgi:hypothetical protein